MPLIDYKGGKGKILTDREMKRRVKEATGWDDKEYKKNYDIFRNKARNFENITGQELPYKINELFYLQNAAKARWGKEYRASELLRGIEATTSESTGAALRRGRREAQKAAERGEAVTGKPKPVYTKEAEKKVFSTLLKPFEALLRKSPKTKAEADALIEAGEPEKAYELVKDYANSRHQKSKEGIRYQVGYD